MMNLELDIAGIEVVCIIGDRPAERITPQKITVEAHLEIEPLSAASDMLEDTVDYVELAEKIRSRLVEAKVQMLERAAFLAAQEALRFPVVKSASVEVTKRGAVEGIEKAVCRCRMERGEENFS